MKLAICDDNILHMQNTTYFISQHLNSKYKNESFEYIQFSNSKDLIDWTNVYGEDLDILLLDISLEDNIDGIEIAQSLNAKYPHIKIIFITAYIEKAINISDADFVYFVYKGSNYKERLKKAIDKAYQIKIQEQKSFILIYNTKISINDIECLIADRKYTRILFSDGSEQRYKVSISSFNLPNNFYNIHRSCIINMDKIEKIVPTDRVLFTNSNRRLLIAKAKFNGFIDEYRKFIGENIIC